MAQVQIIGQKVLGKLPDAAEAGDIVPHDNGRHTEPYVCFAPKLVEGLQIFQNQTKVAADLDLSVILVQLVDGNPDPRDARRQQFPGLFPGQQSPVCDKLCLLPVC